MSSKRLLARLARVLSNEPDAKDISDEYINWLCFANAGMLHRGNLYCMRHAVENLPSANPIVEIGSFCGLSTNAIGYYLKKLNQPNSLFTCDKWLFEGSENGGCLGESAIAHEDYRAFVKSTYMRNVGFFSGARKPFTIEAFSDEFFELWGQSKTVGDVFGREARLGGNIAFCYIDGNHAYKFASRDFANVDRHLDIGGFILFDDSHDGDPYGLSKLMGEIHAAGRYELVIKNPNYLFKKLR